MGLIQLLILLRLCRIWKKRMYTPLKIGKNSKTYLLRETPKTQYHINELPNLRGHLVVIWLRFGCHLVVKLVSPSIIKVLVVSGV